MGAVPCQGELVAVSVLDVVEDRTWVALTEPVGRAVFELQLPPADREDRRIPAELGFVERRRRGRVLHDGAGEPRASGGPDEVDPGSVAKDQIRVAIVCLVSHE